MEPQSTPPPFWGDTFQWILGIIVLFFAATASVDTNYMHLYKECPSLY